MKRITIMLCIMIFGALSYNAYALSNFMYSGTSFSTVGEVQPSATVDVRITIQNASGGYYQEIHTGKTTDQFGGFTVTVGTGGSITGNLGTITTTATTRLQAETNLGGAGWVLSTNVPLSQVMTENVLNSATNNATSGSLMYYDGTNWVAKRAVIQNTGGGQSFNNMQPYLVLNYCIALQGIFPSRAGADPYLAEVEIFAFNFTPTGWAACDGQLLPINQNQALFALLGTMYGGNGQTTFALPDLRGRMPIHYGQGSGLTARTQGETGGLEAVTLTTNQIPAHTHTILYQ